MKPREKSLSTGLTILVLPFKLLKPQFIGASGSAEKSESGIGTGMETGTGTGNGTGIVM